MDSQETLNAALTNVPHVYAASHFTKSSISIVDQQRRCFALCHALATKYPKGIKHIAIVGAGISGMTCAVALAMCTDHIIYVFENDTELLRKFKEASFRFIHPDLNDSATNDVDLYGDLDKRTSFPFMNWQGDWGPGFANQIIRAFDHYRSWAPIALFTGRNIKNVKPKRARVNVTIETSQRAESHSFDLVILATGFGVESKSVVTADTSYWRSGNPANYKRSPALVRARRKERVLISGNGDSAIIELTHFLINDFRHSDIFDFLPTNSTARLLAHHFADGVRHLEYRELQANRMDYPNVSAPISWYWQRRWLIEANLPSRAHFETPLYAICSKHLGRFPIEGDIPYASVSALNADLGKALDRIASHQIRQLVNSYKLDKIFNNKIRNIFSNDFSITVVGSTPFIYSRKQAPINWFLLSVLETYGTFKYRQARLVDSRIRTNQLFGILRSETGTETSLPIDRIVARHGPSFSSLEYGSDIRPVNDTLQGHRTIPLLEDKHFDYFRTNRWKSIIEVGVPLNDDQDLQLPFKFLPSGRRDLDRKLLEFSALGLQMHLAKQYRAAKTAMDEAEATRAFMEFETRYYRRLAAHRPGLKSVAALLQDQKDQSRARSTS